MNIYVKTEIEYCIYTCKLKHFDTCIEFSLESRIWLYIFQQATTVSNKKKFMNQRQKPILTSIVTYTGFLQF